ncbi:helix-turn-helix transcriptional regulator [Clostridium perfringens]|nr:helix-turn-helix transcriptional regulator [Clostridium perfringens]
MSIGKNLREIRRTKGFTMKELSNKSGVSQSYISDLENEKNNKPSIDILIKLANALEISEAILYRTEKNVYNLTDILSQNEGKSINNPTTEEKERLKKTIELAGKISSDVINKINDEALDGMIAIGRYSSLDDEMEILQKATDKQIENILDSLGKQLELELFKLKKVIENE